MRERCAPGFKKQENPEINQQNRKFLKFRYTNIRVNSAWENRHF